MPPHRRRPAWIVVSCAACACLLLATPAQARVDLGLADQTSAPFGDPRVAELGIHEARLVVAWNAALVPAQLAATAAWLAAAAQAGVTPMIAFQHTGPVGPGRAPTPARYLAAFLAFRRAFPAVRAYSPWNEENHPAQPTFHRPDLAAAYFNAVSCHCPGCQVTAADLLDAGNLSSWLTTFLRTARHPRLWGLHPYQDANAQRSTRTRLFLSRVRGEVWFTEAGGLVWRRQDGRLLVPGEVAAARAATYLLRLAASSPRITRVYYYHWRSPGLPTRRDGAPSWDSGLVRADGSARPALAVLARYLHRSLGP
jgi:hypothetical protein